MKSTLLPSNFYLQIGYAGVLHNVWNILEGLQYITVLSLVSISVPGIANQLNSVLLEFSQMDVLPAADIED